MVTVRKAIEDDRFGLFKLAVAMHAESDFACLPFAPEKALGNLGNWMHGREGLMLVAVDGDDVIGMLAATARPPWFSDREVSIEDLFFVRKDHRGGRTAFRLLEGYLAWMRERGIQYGRCGVSTGECGKPAERLYEHFGARRTGATFSINMR